MILKNRMNKSEHELTFWDHLEDFRRLLFRILGTITLLIFVTFSFSNFLFEKVVFSPLNSDFIFYDWINSLAGLLNFTEYKLETFEIQLINYQIAGQFMAQITTSLVFAILLSVPFVLYQLWLFVSPALLLNEKKHAGTLFISSSFLFYFGASIGYFIILPLSVRFLGTYEISSLIPNQISLESYLGMFFLLILLLGLMFELPIVIYFLSKMGLINRNMLKEFRKYALIATLVLAALITPTTDPFTMILVSLPLYLLYETGILVSSK